MADHVAQTDLADEDEIAAEGGLLAFSTEESPDDLLGGTNEPPDTVRNLVAGFDRHGAVNFAGTVADEDDRAAPWVGVGLAHGEDWEMMAVWAFPDAAAAEDGQPDVARVLREESNLGDMVDGDPAELLERDGAILWLRAPFADEEPYSWIRPLQQFDPMFLAFEE